MALVVAITFDPAKSERNVRERGLPFDIAGRMVWSTALIGLAKHQEPTATRFLALGEIDALIHVVVFRFEGDDDRIISLRRADAKERKRWHAVRTPT